MSINISPPSRQTLCHHTEGQQGILSPAEVSWAVLTLGKYRQLQLSLCAHSEPQNQVSETWVELKMPVLKSPLLARLFELRHLLTSA